MSFLQIVIVILVVMILSLSYLVFLNKKKYSESPNNVCVNKKCFLSMFTLNCCLFFLLKVTNEKYQLEMHDLIIIVLMYYFSLVSFLLFKLTSNSFNTKCLITAKPRLIGRIIQQIIILITPLFAYILTIKYDGNIFFYCLFCLMNSTFSIAQGVKLIKIKHRLTRN